MSDTWRRDGTGSLRTRLLAAAAALATIAVALGVRSGAVGMPGAIEKCAGDALYTVLLHTLVVLAVPRVKPVVAATVALGLSWAVEFAQFSSVPGQLAARSTLARLILGSTFNAPDLFWYLVGALVACLTHAALRGAAGARSRRLAH